MGQEPSNKAPGWGATSVIALFAFMAGTTVGDEPAADPSYALDDPAALPAAIEPLDGFDAPAEEAAAPAERQAEREPDRERQSFVAPVPTYRPPDREPQRAFEAPAYFANCSAARAAGAAPVREGDPGYSRRLDRDGDGVGCE